MAAFTDAVKTIMIKILLIPQSKQKSVDELIQIFLKLFEFLGRHFPKGQLEQLRPFYQCHIETAFLLTQHKIRVI